jgi:hypothetical protein
MVGTVAHLAKWEAQLLPRLTEWGLARFIEGYLRWADESPRTEGNLYAPMPERPHRGSLTARSARSLSKCWRQQGNRVA